MYLIRLNDPKYVYDVQALVQSFWPDTKVKVLTPASVIKDRRLLAQSPEMEIVFAPDAVRVEINDLSNINTAKSKIYTYSLTENETRDYKNACKKYLYEALCSYTGKTLPWGYLTGIRPTKLAWAVLAQGGTTAEAETLFTEKYQVSPQKAALGAEIAEREMRILSSLHTENGYSLYVGIPFCPTTCLYCSFTSFPIKAWEDRVGAYLSALEQEMAAVSALMQGQVLDTVYIGGGTPTSLSAEDLERLLASLDRYFDTKHLLEYTVEAGRADSITAEKLAVLQAHGITRISVNPQTMQQKTLDLIGRRHTVEQVREAFVLAREAGFDNINMDLIVGLPGEGLDEITQTLSAVRALSPDSLTVHSLARKKAAGLEPWLANHDVYMLPGKEAQTAMDKAEQTARDMGLSPYYLYRQKNMSGNLENVGYARAGKYGIYNILIMEERQTIMALGAGTVTKRVYANGRIERCDNVKEPDLYMERIEEMIARKTTLLQ